MQFNIYSIYVFSILLGCKVAKHVPSQEGLKEENITVTLKWPAHGKCVYLYCGGLHNTESSFIPQLSHLASQKMTLSQPQIQSPYAHRDQLCHFVKPRETDVDSLLPQPMWKAPCSDSNLISTEM